jgi:hypothetical protein
MNHDGDTERTGMTMLSDEMTILTISGAIFCAVTMLVMLMRKA